jgi:hypothetical protein
MDAGSYIEHVGYLPYRVGCRLLLYFSRRTATVFSVAERLQATTI